MRVALLGPLRAAEDDGTPIDIGGARLRMLLARLALDAGRAVPADALVDGLWGGEPPSDAANALQSLVSRLRKALPVAVESGPGGYRLALGSDDVDAERFERLAADGRRELAAGRDVRAAELLTEALALWQGDALADVLDAPFAAAPARRLAGLRAEAAEDRFDALVRLGEHAGVLADLSAAADADPLRERLAGLRMRALCAAGRQPEALVVYAGLRRTLTDQLGVDPSAELQEIHVAALRGELAPPSPVADRLPTRLTTFVGRDDELKLLAELLGGARLVTLTGPGGAGKTRLATEAASRHPAHQRGRVWFAALAGVRDPDDVGGALLGALEVRDIRTETEVHRRQADPVAQAVEVLGGAEALLVLDNCEHVVDAAARLADELLHRAPRLRILATSREPLAITGEALCPLGPLPVPAERAAPAEAAELDSTRLFLDRAAAVRPDFVLDESTVDQVGEICRRLDGMPLALELAAARLRSMSVAQIAGRLGDRFRLLTSGSRTALPRQRTLRAVVEWSWDLLTEPELVLARRLAVFAGGAELESIEAVCADNTGAGNPGADELLPAADVPYVLGSLVEKSIVDTVAGVDGEPRYRMLETLRAYATERLAESGEYDRMRRAVASYYAELAQRLEPTLRTGEQLRAIDQYEAESANMVAALRGAIEMSDVDNAVGLLDGMFWYLTVLGQGSRVGGLIREALAFGERLPPEVAAAYRALLYLMDEIPVRSDRDGILELVDDCVRSDAVTRYPGLAVALPMLAFLGGDREVADREVRRAQQHADPWTRAGGHWVDSFLLEDLGDVEGAYRARDLAHAGFSAVGDRWGLAMTLSFKASALSQDGESAKAIETFQEGLALSMELRSHEDAVQQWWRLAVERARTGDIEGAWRDQEAAERYGEAITNVQHRAILMFGRMELLLRTGDVAGARALLDRVKELGGDDWFPGGIGDEFIHVFEARILLLQGRAEEAEGHLAVAIQATNRRGDMPDMAGAVELLAMVRARQGRYETAARVVAASAVVRGRLDRGSPELRELIAELREALPDYDERYERARQVSKKDIVAWLLDEAGGND
ncbi:AfsR/SARP family transcriptional regulator [Amycolatopsis balhimycina DSM 5908]|uniref:AfsR/SARP family transcriptional regulator n=1 Tax=Amycolatopsis balhimycina DSM 5908 TaxID=1081091 RepID=A0A428WF19_AMYBA|nr:BTAD domain-containing putative transcriptional regulator [Amycolatopsis balhimycina]RSM41640.1 AfsR/SARP family transcriptional regulator [Amycolatopsis balhimycina DSM 5908]